MAHDPDKALRKQVIRLARTNPSLRPHLLPLLRTAASARVMMRYQELKNHLKNRSDTDGLDLLEDLADVIGL